MAWFSNINKWFINIRKSFININKSFNNINKCWAFININKSFSNINKWAPSFVCRGSLYMWNNEYPLHVLGMSVNIWLCCLSDVNFKCIFDLFSISLWFPWDRMWMIYLILINKYMLAVVTRILTFEVIILCRPVLVFSGSTGSRLTEA